MRCRFGDPASGTLTLCTAHKAQNRSEINARHRFTYRILHLWENCVVWDWQPLILVPHFVMAVDDAGFGWRTVARVATAHLCDWILQTLKPRGCRAIRISTFWRSRIS